MGYNVMTPSGLRMDISFATGFVIEMGLYSVYTCLFVAAFPGMTRIRRLKDSRSAQSARVFLIFSTLMYLVATTHLILAAFRFYKSTFSSLGLSGAIPYLQDPNNREFLGLIILLCIQTWLGDALVIYRCYVVWDNNLWLITIPVCLLLGSIGINLYALHWIRHPSTTTPAPGVGLFRSIYPFAFVQSFMATCLILLKILLQHQELKKSGVGDTESKFSLMYIVRMAIESAGIYTIQILILNILFFKGDNFQYVVQSAIIPSIGITAILLAVRIEAARIHKTAKQADSRNRISNIRQWPREPVRGVVPEDRDDCSSLPEGDDNDVPELGLTVDQRSDVDWDPEPSSSSAPRRKAAATSFSSSKYGDASTSKVGLDVY